MVPPPLALRSVIVNVSTGCAAFDSFKGTNTRSCDLSCSVPHCPCCLLKTRFQVLASTAFCSQRLYSPAGTTELLKSRSVPDLKVVEVSAPSRQKPPDGNFPSRSSVDRPLSEGRPYSTETVFPLRVIVDVPRGLPCASSHGREACYYQHTHHCYCGSFHLILLVMLSMQRLHIAQINLNLLRRSAVCPPMEKETQTYRTSQRYPCWPYLLLSRFETGGRFQCAPLDGEGAPAAHFAEGQSYHLNGRSRL